MRHVVLTVPAADAELAADRLWSAGATALEERDVTDGVELRTVLAADDDVSRSRLGALPGSWALVFVDVDPVPSEQWREFAAPIEVNERLIVRPAWIEDSSGADVLSVAIDPGAAFGLGDHPTTRLSADAVDRLVRPGDRVLDAGCGSGVLGVVAARRGAGRVVAIDTSEAAREATVANAVRNGVAGAIDASTTPIAEIDGDFDLVLANILAPVLIDIAADLVRLTSPAGRLVVSGVLAGRWQHVADALAPMAVHSTARLGEWSAVTFRHR